MESYGAKSAKVVSVRPIGEGQFALVDLCKLSVSSESSTILVAVKRLKPGANDTAQFQQEAHILPTLKHRHIVRYIDLLDTQAETESRALSCNEDHEGGDAALVEEYLSGGSLRDMVLQQMLTTYLGAYTNIQAMRWMREVADGLQYLHSLDPKVVHRDIKLENILLREVGDEKEACIIDFGLSVSLVLASEQSVTEEGQRKEGNYGVSTMELAGTPEEISSRKDWAGVGRSGDMTGQTGSYMYMAPEVFNSKPYDEKADVFSFGCMLSEMFCGYNLSSVVTGGTGTTEAVVTHARKVAGGYRHPLPTGLPSALKDLINSCLAQEPEARPSMADVRGKLDNLESSGVLQAIDASKQDTFEVCRRCTLM